MNKVGESKKRRHPAGLYYPMVGALALLATSIPYLYGWLHTPSGTVYSGFTYNIDDSCVYLSWMRQAQNGHFFIHNQFSTDPQRGVLFNLLFWLLGTLVRLTHIPSIDIYHGTRILGGALFLWAVWGLQKETIATERARRIGFAFVCFGAGLGWLFGGYQPQRSYGQPVDLWQPEAISFLAIYFSPLFSCALAGIVLFMRSAIRSEKSGRLRDAIPAMIAGALLGNFHSYDVIPVFASWVVYRIVSDIRMRRLDLAAWIRFIVVGLAALPTTGYIYYALKVDPVFYRRAFISATLSPAVRWDLLGLGLPLLLAIIAGTELLRRRSEEDTSSVTFLLTWAVVGIAAAYIPVAFQRKLLMGVHVPICLLGGCALAALTEKLSGDFPKIAAFFVVLLSTPSNVLFLTRDLDRVSENLSSTSHQPYLKETEIAALEYLRKNTRPEDAVIVSPDATSQARFPGFALEPYLSVYVPAMAGNVVYDGHWSETANYPRKLSNTRRFFRAGTDDGFRTALLANSGIRYVLYDNRLAQGPPKGLDGNPVSDKDGVYTPVNWVNTDKAPIYLRIVYRNTDISIYVAVD